MMYNVGMFPTEHNEHTDHSKAASPKSLQGWVPNTANTAELLAALNQAFDYRGDVTLTLREGRSVEGYIFDRRTGTGLADSFIRIMPAGKDEKLKIAYDQIARLEFTGKDTAAGKSWENWIKRYIEKKRAGEQASIESEKLD